MIQITDSDIQSLYLKIKGKAFKDFQKGNIEKALKSISTAAKIAYKSCFIYKDDELEYLLSDISFRILPKETNIFHTGNYVLIDAFGIPNIGLTQQYLRGLISMNVDFLYISEDVMDRKETIYTEVRNSIKGKLCLVPKGKRIEQIKFIYEEIINFKPSAILTHITPWDVVATTVLYALPQCAKYNINLTDHTFGLGAGCSDYTIEFREYGCTVSSEKRGFTRDRILLIPYYPIIDDSEFMGFPEITKGKVILFSGGSYYKIYGEDYAFLKMMEHVLKNNPNAILLYAGSGDDKPLRKFLKENHLEDRFILLGYRKDINQVFAHCDIYLGTYPSAGGLMTQYAAHNSKPVVAYTKLNVSTNKIDDLVFKKGSTQVKLTYTDLDKYYTEINKLISNIQYRNSMGLILKRSVYTKDTFDNNLKKGLLHRKGEKFSFVEIDYDERRRWYLELLNINIWEIGGILLKNYLFLSFAYSPKIVLKSLLCCNKKFSSL